MNAKITVLARPSDVLPGTGDGSINALLNIGTGKTCVSRNKSRQIASIFRLYPRVSGGGQQNPCCLCTADCYIAFRPLTITPKQFVDVVGDNVFSSHGSGRPASASRRRCESADTQ